MSTLLQENQDAIAAQGMLPAWHASRCPNDIALFSCCGDVAFAELDARANQFANACREAGLKPGDAVAIVAGNRPEFVQVLLGCLRSGLRLTPISWRLEPRVISHILDDCNARALIIQPGLIVDLEDVELGEAALRLSIDGDVPGFVPFDWLGAFSDTPPSAPQHGQFMLYTSGTTGPPKGVLRSRARIYKVQGPGTHAGYRPGDVNLLCGPAFHSAPLYHDLILPLVSGVPVVMMEKFDARQTLELIERRRVTHTHMVPTMFHRLLSLPEGVRDSYDLSSLRQINHGAAPTPVPVKRAMIGWVGPILSEYYAATEGGAGFRISSAEWLQKPGSVGKVRGPASVTVLDEAGRPCAPGVSGRVFLPNGADGVCSTYHRNDAETTRTFSGTHFTVGDTGYIDGDGYLFLTGRTADRIISGGVNIQPQEIDDVLLAHPDVVAACSVGVPNADWGEEVRAVVVVRPEIRDMAALEKALLAWAGERLAGYKVPKHVDFVDALPFSDAGKLQRADVRRRYWKDSERQI